MTTTSEERASVRPASRWYTPQPGLPGSRTICASKVPSAVRTVIRPGTTSVRNAPVNSTSPSEEE
ncbi:hypothetical protein LUW77_17355 [Streptomyces radiopugnans]|nr:hypothetical protein LUW77_17355 [Streptomyces radiopugnans]